MTHRFLTKIIQNIEKKFLLKKRIFHCKKEKMKENALLCKIFARLHE